MLELNRNFLGTLLLAVLAGCVSPSDLKETGPAFVGITSKSPRDYSRCLTPRWQELNPNVSSTETDSGYRMLLNIDMVGTPVMAVADANSSGSVVSIYVRNSTWSKWVDVAKSCI